MGILFSSGRSLITSHVILICLRPEQVLGAPEAFAAQRANAENHELDFTIYEPAPR